MSEERVKEGYAQVSNSICVVAYDASGAPISDEIAEKVVKAVEEVTEEERLIIMFTRQ